jgi:predicted TIM-barrel fold metal-dependent hydrolase
MAIFDAHLTLPPALQPASGIVETLVSANTPRELVATLDRYGIAGGILFGARVAGADVYDLNYRMANRAVYEATRAYPDRLIGFARINPSGFVDCTNELIRCKDEYGFRGLMLNGEWDYFFPGGVTTEPYLSLAQAWHWPVFFHIGTWPLTQPAMLIAVAKRYPRLVMIAAHLGYAMIEDAIAVSNLCPNVFLETSPNATPSQIQEVVRACGARKLIFGSGLPYALPDHQYDKIRRLPGLTAADRDAILGGTARELLGLN